MAHALKHEDLAKKSDDALREEARAHLARQPKLQVVAELLDKLRLLALPWWSPQRQRNAFPSRQRMDWYAERADLRQAITHGLTGLAPKAARALTPEAQADLLDAVIDCGDVDCARFEAAFDPKDLVAYGPVVAFWKQFRENMPWDSQTRPHQELVAWLIKILLAEKGEGGVARRPLLTPYDVRTAIPASVWHKALPIEVRVAIDEARLAREKNTPREPFLAKDELEIATPDVLATHVPLRDLQRIVLIAEKALGFDAPAEVTTATATPAKSGKSVTTPPSMRESGVTSRPVLPPLPATPSKSNRPEPAAHDARDTKPPPGDDGEFVFDDDVMDDEAKTGT